jgi:2-aminoethylphosphonate-pyruvate transaminase
VARADTAETVARWATARAINLWIVVGPSVDLGPAVDDGATVHGVHVTTSFTVFDTMAEVGVDDVRRVGVVSRATAGLEAGRKAGAAAVIGVADDPRTAAELLAAQPDAIVSESGLGELYGLRYASNRPFRPQVLLSPGPALTSDAVKRAAAGVDLCHREPEFTVLEQRVREKLLRVAEVGPGWRVALMSGSGTGADEMALRGAVRPGKRALVVVNGVYGERLRAIAERAGIPVVVHERGWTEPADVAGLAALLGVEANVDALAVVYHETTTGLLNPVADIAAVCRDVGVRVVVDGVSSFGVEELVLDGSGVDFLACSSNKCLQGLPGAAFVLVSAAGQERLADVPPTSVYLDLQGYLEGETRSSVPFTPAVPALAALDAALDELLVLGPEAHRQRYAERAAILDDVLGGLGLEPIVAPEHRSRTVRSVPLPAGVRYAPLHDELKRHGYVIYAGQGPLAKEIFRVCCLGMLEPEVLRAFGDRLGAAIESQQAVPA